MSNQATFEMSRPALRYAAAEESEAEVHSLTDPGDAQERFRLYRLCPCEACEASGKIRTATGTKRCPECRGEGRVRQQVASCGTEQAVGVALVTLGREGEWADCPFGLLDSEGETGQKWLISPWLPSARNVSDAGRVLQTARKEK